MLRRVLAPVSAAMLVFAACGGDDSASSPSDAVDTTTAASETEARASDSTVATDETDDSASADDDTGGLGSPAPSAIDTLQPPSDPSLLVGDAPAEALAALGFPEGWVGPEGGTDDVVGVEVSYEQGDGIVYSHHTSTYRAGPGDPEKIAKKWAGIFADALGIDTERLGTITGGPFLTVAWSSVADAEPGKPKLEVDAISVAGDPNADVLVKVEFTSHDALLPASALPFDLDPTLPGVDSCSTRQTRVELVHYQDTYEQDRVPSYTIRWEGTCAGLDTFEAGLQWFRDNGRPAPDGTTAMSDSVESEDGVVIEVRVAKRDDGDTSYSLSFIQQIPLD